VKKLAFFLIVLIKLNMTAFAENAITDPTLMTETLKQGIAVLNVTRPENSASTDAVEKLNDPTSINQNFREALTHANQLKAAAPDVANPLGKLVPDSNTPKIGLIANVHKNQERKRVILRVNNKSEIVNAGDTITYFQGSEVLQINVVEITKNYVKVTLMPANQTLILR